MAGGSEQRPAPVAAVPESPGSGFGYRAFISYSHRDRGWADWLHRSLETYRVPSRLVGARTARGPIPRRLNPIFRDREEFASSDDLGRSVNEALAQSENLLVVCSPSAASARWVNEEVLAFKRMGRGDRIFCLVVDGEPGVSDWPGHEGGECFCPALRYALDEHGQPTRERAEPIAADVRPGKDSKAVAKLKLIAGMLGVGFDVLAQRDAHRRHRRLLLVTVASLLGMTIAAGLAFTAWVARNEARQRQAQTEDALNFMLGDLHDKLEGMGRLDLMAAVTDKAMALFATSTPGSLSDLELTQQSRALVQIGEIRMQEARPGPAMDAFQRAYQRSSELTTRHPRNGRFLYDRAQAEYWIGYVYWQQRKLDPANEWLTRYRDSALALVQIDRHNKDWQLETTYGEHNLAVLALERGDLDAAQEGFRAELATKQRLLRDQPNDTGLVADVADTISWLGNVAQQRGDLAGAERLFNEQVRKLGELRTREPGDFRWLAAWANAQELLAASLSTLGRNEESAHALDQAASAYQTLTNHDPHNISWQVGLASVQIRRASQAFAMNDPEQSAKLLSVAMERLQFPTPTKTSQGEREAHRTLSRGWLLRAGIAIHADDRLNALSAANRALAEARNNMPTGASDDDSVADQADALVVLGLAQYAQAPETPPPAWTQARALLARRAPDSRYWRILDPWVRLCRLTGDTVHAQRALDRLTATGYVPLQTWPAIDTSSSPPPTTAGDHHAN